MFVVKVYLCNFSDNVYPLCDASYFLLSTSQCENKQPEVNVCVASIFRRQLRIETRFVQKIKENL
jgi:hypothetical protein